MYFSIKDEKFLEKYNEIWGKLSNLIKEKFNSEPEHNEDKSKRRHTVQY